MPRKKKSASKLKKDVQEPEFIEVPTEITFTCPERGKVTQTVMVKKYISQTSPIPTTR
jgi:hypothetical protein